MSVDGADLGAQTLTVHRANPDGGEDGYGNPTQGAPIVFTIPGCALQPLISASTTSENVTPSADVITTRYRAFLPYGADLTGTDEVLMGDIVLQVDGDVVTWEPDEYGDGHREAYLERKAG